MSEHALAPAVRGPSLAWQYGLLLVTALLLSHLIVMALLQRTGELIHPISREQALTTLATAYTLAIADRDAAARYGQAFGRQEHHIPPAERTSLWLDRTYSVASFEMQPVERQLAAELRERLAPTTDTLRLQMERVSGKDARASLLSLAAWEPLRLRASIALPDGRWLNASMPIQGRYDWSRILMYALPASVLPVLTLALFLAWRLVQPLRTLISATAGVRYGREQPALPLRGPREARELTAQFNAMQQRLARHRDARTRMLAAISHDLRTPVTALRVQAELIEEVALRDDMLASITELQNMVDTTLDFARADAHAEPWQQIDICSMLRHLAARHARLGQIIKLPQMRPDHLIWSCRPLALKRALGNLLDNAHQHAGDATIEFHTDQDSLKICVLDHGPGIAPDLIGEAFEPFRQIDPARGPARSGVGLGLSIALTCIEAQGGTLILENRKKGGLRATVRLTLL